MYRRYLALATFIVLGGCLQMTRHSNTMVFGTNTSLGISVGADAASTPAVTVGYKRQEAVVMPLIANTTDDGTTMKPCAQPTNGGELPANCLLVGKNGSEEPMQDTYSVLASFGTDFTASAADRNAGGKIAQYFATGIAARKLAENGGAATVALGGAAVANSRALGSDKMLGMLRSPETRKIALKEAERIAVARNSITAKINAAADYTSLLNKLDATRPDGTGEFASTCGGASSAVACASAISEADDLGMSATEWEIAANALNG